MTVKPDTQVLVSFVAGSLPKGEFIAGLPADGSPVLLPAAEAQALISAGLAKSASAAAPAAQVVAERDVKEKE